jgi:hypothetical protein
MRSRPAIFTRSRRSTEDRSHCSGTIGQKFGPPTSVSHERVQNLAGAAFDSVTATWRGGEVDVTFYGTNSKLDMGDVYIDLPEVTAMRREVVRARAGPKM